MSKPNLKRGWAKELSKDALIQVLEVVNGDGHTIFKTEPFDKLPTEIVGFFAEEIESDVSDPKEMIFGDRGEVLPFVFGIYGLRLVESIGFSLGLVWEDKMGRGWRCRAVCEAIREHVKSMPFTEGS